MKTNLQTVPTADKFYKDLTTYEFGLQVHRINNSHDYFSTSKKIETNE